MSDTTNTSQTQALLVSLRFGLPRQSRQSKPEAQRVEQVNHAHRGVTRVSINYFSEQAGAQVNDALFELKQFQNAWRTEHMRLTRPWDGGSTRLLPAKLIELYLESKARFERDWPAKVAEFISVYPDWRITAPDRMGNLFSESDYPTCEECRNDITYDCAIMPLPAAEQFKRITLISPNLAADMEASTNQRIARAMEEVKTQTFKDVLEPIQKIVDTLSKDRPRIFDSMIGNLNAVIELVPAFNLSNDADLNRLASEAKAALSTVNPDDLRADPAIRKQTCKKAEELLGRFAQFGARKFA